MRLVFGKCWGFAWLAVALSLVSSSSRAEPSANDKAASEALFQEGKQLLERGDYERACAKFAASQELDAGFGTLMNLGDCFEKRRMTASAWATFKEAASSARAQGQADREAAARERASVLESRLSQLVIRVSSQVAELEGLEVRLNRTSLPQAVWGARVPVDPGTQRLEVRAPGYRAFSREISVEDAAESVVEVPLLEREAATASPTTAAAAPTASTSEASTSGSQTQRTVGFVLGGAGVVGLAIGSVFGLSAISKNDESMDHCRTEKFCDDAGLSLREDAKDAAGISTLGFVAGGVLAIGGLTLILTTPRSGTSSDTGTIAARPGPVSLTPFIGRRGAGFGVRGRF